jgi:hypothetical protein
LEKTYQRLLKALYENSDEKCGDVLEAKASTRRHWVPTREAWKSSDAWPIEIKPTPAGSVI